MSRVWLALLVASIGVSLPLPAGAGESREVGVVLLHGWGLQHESRRVSPHAWNWLLAKILRDEGFRVIEEEMPWGPNRLIDAPLDKAMEEIDAQVAKLKAEGAKKIVIAGHSMGAAMALAYAAGRDGLTGVIGLAPGHHPEVWPLTFPELFPGQVQKARAAIAAGAGDERTTFRGVQCCVFFRDFSTTPYIYLSYFDPEGPATMQRSAPRVKPGVPVLLVYGKRDYIFDLFNGVKLSYADHVSRRLPPNSRHRVVMVDADHGDVPSRAGRDVVGWLTSLP